MKTLIRTLAILSVAIGTLLIQPATAPESGETLVAAESMDLWAYHRFIIFDWCSDSCEGGLCCKLVVI